MPGQKVFVGDHIRTLSKSRCEITLKTGGKVRIGEHSELELGSADIKPMEKNFNASLKREISGCLQRQLLEKRRMYLYVLKQR